MFDLPRTVDDARRAQKLESLYHRGQDLAWDGRAVLSALIDKHGGVHVPADKREALGQIFAVIMWGELAAWKVSVQLADRLVALEPKMAATSQAHDEARHFYVMHDYLEALGQVPRGLDRPSRAVLELVLGTRSLLKKLLGMQLMVEALALTIFQLVRETRVEPVLTELLRYYEKDEARHVGLGVQLLPQMMRGLSRLETADLILFQVRILGWTLAGLKHQEPAWRTLGVDPRRIIELGRAKQALAFQELGRQLGVERVPRWRLAIIRGLKGVGGALFAGDGDGAGVLARVRAFVREAGGPLEDGLVETSLHPDEPPRMPTVPRAR
jgi:hypothetical protein